MNKNTILLILQLTDLLAIGMRLGPKLLNDYQDLRKQVNKFVEEDRDPTMEEFGQLRARAETIHQRILAAQARLHGSIPVLDDDDDSPAPAAGDTPADEDEGTE